MVKISTWQRLSETPILSEGEIHLYRVGLFAVTDENRNLLSPAENHRAGQLLDPLKQQRFIVCRVKLRQILSQYLDRSAQGIVFRESVHGKPVLAQNHHSDLVFNLSHSENCAVIAVSQGADIGVDIEKIDLDLEFHKLANYFFDHNEQKLLQQTPSSRQRRMFYRIWTAKESRLKMAGTGFVQSHWCDVSSSYSHHFYLSPTFVATLSTAQKMTSIKKYGFSS